MSKVTDATATPAPNKTILIVDDQLQGLGPLIAMLQLDGYNVVTASDAKEARDKLGDISIQIDLIIIDNDMPEDPQYHSTTPVSGYDPRGINVGRELIREIREDSRFPRYKNTPVILLTADDLSRQQQEEFSNFSYVRKVGRATDTVVEKVNELLGTGRSPP